MVSLHFAFCLLALFSTVYRGECGRKFVPKTLGLEVCLDVGKKYHGGGLSSNSEIPGIKSAAGCQDLCHQRSECKYFTWTGPNYSSQHYRNTCWLMKTKGSPRPCPECISGPKSCAISGASSNFRSSWRHTAIRAHSDDKSLQLDHHPATACSGSYEYGVEYSHNDIKSCQSNKKPNPQACQEFCKTVPGCVGWEWGYDGDNCCAKSIMKNRNFGNSGRVAGLRDACPPGIESSSAANKTERETKFRTLQESVESLQTSSKLETKILDEILAEISSMRSDMELMSSMMDNRLDKLVRQVEDLREIETRTPPRLPDKCLDYKILNDSWRHIDYANRGPGSNRLLPHPGFCDQTGSDNIYYGTKTNLDWGVSWYRFMGAAGTKLPTAPTPSATGGGPRYGYQICGIEGVAWISGGNPTRKEGIVTRDVCFEWSTDSCMHKNTVKVAACRDTQGEYFVYQLQEATYCPYGYCAID